MDLLYSVQTWRETESVLDFHICRSHVYSEYPPVFKHTSSFVFVRVTLLNRFYITFDFACRQRKGRNIIFWFSLYRPLINPVKLKRDSIFPFKPFKSNETILNYTLEIYWWQLTWIYTVNKYKDIVSLTIVDTNIRLGYLLISAVFLLYYSSP